MKLKKIKFGLACLWEAFISFTAPVCMGIIYMDITGHAKGYGYDLGSERDISVMIGIAELLVWLLLVLPCSIFVFREMHKYGKVFVLITVGMMALLFTGCIFVTGGFNEFLSWFGIS